MSVVNIEGGIKLRAGMGVISTGGGYTLLIPDLELNEISELRAEFIQVADYSNKYECAEQLTEFIYERIQYDDSPVSEDKISLKEAINLKKGVCKEIAAVYQILAQGLDLETRYVRGRLDGAKHAWVKVRVGGQIFYSDPTNGAFLPYKSALEKYNIKEGINRVQVPGKNKEQFVEDIS